jgi:hypothetical protein
MISGCDRAAGRMIYEDAAENGESLDSVSPL